MSARGALHTAQHDVAKLQGTLTTVQSGLDTIDAAAETLDQARRGVRRSVKFALILATIGVIAMIVMSKRSKTSSPPMDDTD